MTGRLYFDDRELERGNFFDFTDEIRTEEGPAYELEDRIGRGGNAVVFQGRDRITDEDCAIKFLMRLGLENRNRFSREVELLKSVKGNHVTRYLGSGRLSARGNRTRRRTVFPFIVMELADCNLQEVMENEDGPLSYERYAGQFRGLADALASLHDLAAIHRDIKPENILVTGERWLLSDYGLCTFVSPGEVDLTREEQNVGPKYWFSPEAHNRRLGRADEICAASDVFQLAAIFWYVATGRHPSGIVTEADWRGTENWHGTEKLFSVLHASLFHDATKRPRNGREFFDHLADALSSP